MTGDRHDGEIRDGIGRVWTRFLEEVIDRRGWLTQRQLEEVFVGYPQPRRLTIESTREPVRTYFNEFARMAGLPDSLPFEVQRPKKIEEIESKLTKFPIVVLEGNGGNGKSTLLAQIARNQANIAFAAGRQALQLQKDWPSECIRHWRNCSQVRYSSESTHKALERLPIERKLFPYVIFALDSLDEAELNTHLNDLIVEFGGLPSNWRSYASLLVSCRDHKQIPILRTFGEEQEYYTVVKTGEFSYAELEDSLQKGNGQLSETIKEALITALSSSYQGPNAALKESPLTVDEYGSFNGFGVNSLSKLSTNSTSPQESNVLQSLCHPVVWKHFCAPQLDDATRRGILNDQRDAWNLLAEKMIEWFCEKFENRASGPTSSLNYEAGRALQKVSAACPNFGQTYNKDQWDNAWEQQTRMPALFMHAVSSGLVKGDTRATGSPYWRWRHEFLLRHLVSLHSTYNPS